jgi:hypothetical protein
MKMNQYKCASVSNSLDKKMGEMEPQELLSSGHIYLFSYKLQSILTLFTINNPWFQQMQMPMQHTGTWAPARTRTAAHNCAGAGTGISAGAWAAVWAAAGTWAGAWHYKRTRKSSYLYHTVAKLFP